MSKDKKNKDIRPSVPKDTSESGTEGKNQRPGTGREAV